MHCRAARDAASSSYCKQMITEPTHIDGGVLDLVLTDVHYIAGDEVASLLEHQIIVPFYRYYAGATYSSLGVKAGGLSHELCGLGAG